MTRRWWMQSLGMAAARGQESPIFRSEVRVVNVVASVRDKHGSYINDLRRQDFTVLDEGVERPIRYFSNDFNLPLTIGLVIDTSMSQRAVLDAERAACYRFLDRVLRESMDRAFLVQFDMAVQIKVGLTNSRKALEDGLDSVDTPSRNELRVQRGGGTLYFDALRQAGQILTGVDNRKALLVLSDGDDWGSESGFQQGLEAAQKNDVVVYGIYYGSGSASGWRAMERMSKATGGSFYALTKKFTAEQVFAQIEQELRHQYSLGFQVDASTGYPGIRKLQVKTLRKDLIVQARTGYWSRR